MLLTVPEYIFQEETGCITLDKNFIYYAAARQPRISIKVPRGFSLFAKNRPMLLRYLLDWDKNCVWPLIIMDYLYQSGGVLKDLTLSRKQCDEVIEKALKESGAHSWSRRFIVTYMRLLGHRFWHESTET